MYYSYIDTWKFTIITIIEVLTASLLSKLLLSSIVYITTPYVFLIVFCVGGSKGSTVL